MTDLVSQRLCGSCGAALNVDWSVCRRCGTAQAAPSDREHERALLYEWAMVASGAIADAKQQADVRAVSRNGLIPNDPDLLVEEAERCIRFAREGQAVFEQRLDALLTRLELLALKEPVLTRRADVLRKARTELSARARNENLGCLAGTTAVLAVAGGLIALMMSRCG